MCSASSGAFPGTGSIDHLRENAAAASLTLTARERARLDDAT